MDSERGQGKIKYTYKEPLVRRKLVEVVTYIKQKNVTNRTFPICSEFNRCLLLETTVLKTPLDNKHLANP